MNVLHKGIYLFHIFIISVQNNIWVFVWCQKSVGPFEFTWRVLSSEDLSILIRRQCAGTRRLRDDKEMRKRDHRFLLGALGREGVRRTGTGRETEWRSDSSLCLFYLLNEQSGTRLTVMEFTQRTPG